MWQAEKKDPGYDQDRPITRALFPDRADVVVHDERGRVSCICPETGEERAMAFQGFEANRGFCGTLKYRCPAAAFGFECAGRDACHRAGGVEPGEYGRIVRIDLDSHDRRIFTPTPWGSPSLRRGYRRRSAMERINSRIDQGFGFETHYIRGLAKMKARIGLALAVMMALALGQVRAGRPRRADALAGRRGAAARRRLTLRPPSDIADRPGRLPADGTLRPHSRPCSRIVPIWRGIGGFCSPGRIRQTISARTRPATRARKTPQRTSPLPS